ALGVALPAVAFGLVAGGERTADAALAGSSAAFVLRIAVLAIPLGLLTLRVRPATAAAESPA
ncbi:MAG TPA: hypothetical protein VHK06_06085, partial [Candidatus Limnocylindria bacterium]|nr:hypothetical protein [Candidatus Limnocylindria bacterium]